MITLDELKQKSTLELKGMVYDLSVQMQQLQETLRVVNELIGQKQSEEVKKDEEKTND